MQKDGIRTGFRLKNARDATSYLRSTAAMLNTHAHYRRTFTSSWNVVIDVA